jgi:phenylalanyl-tRNA synthetase alpha subunit
MFFAICHIIKVIMSYPCQTCNKHYTKKSSLDKHNILCQFLHTKKVVQEEPAELPSYKQLWNIVQELGIKYTAVESRLEEVQKWTQQQKRKIHVEQWLNTNIKPIQGFESWTKELSIDHEDLERLLSRTTMVNVILEIFKHNISQEEKMTYPLVCFDQKVNLFYIYKESTSIWEKYESEEFIVLVKQLHKRLMIELNQWKKAHEEELHANELLLEQYNKAFSKLTSIQFLQASTKIRSGLYAILKTDLKTQIEYVF